MKIILITSNRWEILLASVRKSIEKASKSRKRSSLESSKGLFVLNSFRSTRKNFAFIKSIS